MLHIYEPKFVGNEEKYVLDCMKTGWISSQGSYIKKFEASLAEYHDVKHAIVTSNCTTALHLSLLGLELGKGCDVLCPDLTFIAPANMIKLSGARPVLVDIDPETLTIDINDMKSKLTIDTKAIMVVHQFGHAAQMDEIISFAQKHDLKVIEDNAESIGGYFKNQLLGSIGDVATLSFFANKIITSGEGGAILTNHDDVATRARMLRDHGMNPELKYDHKDLGFNYRMTNLQAAVGLAQLEKLDHILALRNEMRLKYEDALSSIQQLKIRKFSDWCTPVHWLMTLTAETVEMRDRLMTALSRDQIETRPMINPVHHAHHFRAKYDWNDFPVSCDISARSFHLPSGNNISSDKINYITTCIRKFFDNE